MVVGTFNQEKALVGAFSVIVKLQTSQRFVSSSNALLSLSSDVTIEASSHLPYVRHSFSLLGVSLP